MRTIGEALAALEAKRATAEAITRAALDAAKANAALNALAAIDADAALELARARDRAGWTGPLHGIPVTVKDLFATEGLPTRAGTNAPLPPLGSEAEVVRRLRAAGAVILAKVNMHEVALGLTGENPITGDVPNPHDPARQSGGSSSGSGAAVAAGIGFASLGSDTGGSVRVPAALCGVVGFKPSFGLVPLDGALPLSPTCDHAGPLVRSVADARLVTEVLAGRALAHAAPDAPRFGVPAAYLDGRLSATMRAAFEAAIGLLRANGAVVVDVDAPGIEQALAAYTPLVRAEAARVHRHALEHAPGGFSEVVRTTLIAAQGLSAAEYLEAREARRAVRRGVTAALAQVDALLVPTTPDVAPVRGTLTVMLESGEAVHRTAQLALTAPFNLAGVPAVSLPLQRAGGLPLGMQVVGRFGEDARALAAAEWVERAIYR